MSCTVNSALVKFQFTHPGRGATTSESVRYTGKRVSIHAPREGCDCVKFSIVWGVVEVSIHAPREGCDLS